MLFRNITDIKYPTLRNMATQISKSFKTENIYMDREGGICITIQGKLNEEEVKEALSLITPNGVTTPDELTALEYSYSDDMQWTYVYSPDGISYKE